MPHKRFRVMAIKCYELSCVAAPNSANDVESDFDKLEEAIKCIRANRNSPLGQRFIIDFDPESTGLKSEGKIVYVEDVSLP